MRILNRYITRDYLITFLTTVAVFSFIMCIGTIIRAIDLMSRGVSGGAIARYFLLSFPYILQFTVPMSAMTTALLLFTRLSMDGEINAMKACGLSLWQIISPVVVLAVALSFLSMYVSNTISPASRYAQREIMSHFADEDPVSLLDEGRFVREFPDHMVYVGKKNGRQLQDIIIYQMDGEEVKTNIRARWGTIRKDVVQQKLLIDLYDVRIEQADGKHRTGDQRQMRIMTAQHYPKEMDLSEMNKGSRVKKKISDYTLPELYHAIREVAADFPGLELQDLLKERMTLQVEASNRMALSLSCFAFTLLGVPLGLRSRRKESSVGVAVSLLIIFIFYFFMMVAKATTAHPELRPDLIVWIPVLVAEVLGLGLIRRAN